MCQSQNFTQNRVSIDICVHALTLCMQSHNIPLDEQKIWSLIFLLSLYYTHFIIATGKKMFKII
jgi:hypothetical protein